MKKSKEPSLPSTGLGDTIKAITEFFGIPQCDACKERQAYFNKLFSYMKASRPLTLEETEFITRLKASRTFSTEENRKLFALYNEIFSQRAQACNCAGIISSILEKLEILVPKTHN